MSETYAHLYRLPMTGLRFFTVYGPWGRPDMAMWIFTKAIIEGQPIDVFGEGNMRRDFTYVDDIVTGVVACLDNPPPDDGAVKAGGSVGPHRVYNIGNHRSEELTRMIGLIEARRSASPRSVRLQPMQPGDVRDTHADIAAIQPRPRFRADDDDRRRRAAVRGVVPRLPPAISLKREPLRRCGRSSGRSPGLAGVCWSVARSRLDMSRGARVIGGTGLPSASRRMCWLLHLRVAARLSRLIEPLETRFPQPSAARLADDHRHPRAGRRRASVGGGTPSPARIR